MEQNNSMVVMEQNNSMVVDVDLDIVKFIYVTESIAREYFDDNGNYTPHIGLLNAMCVFYNECVKESKYDDEVVRPVLEGIELRDVVQDKEFVDHFNSAISNYCNALNFGTAYWCALDIVNQKKATATSVIELIKNAIIDLVENMGNVFTEDNIAKITSLADSLKKDDSLNNIVDIVKRAEKNIE